MHASSHVRTRPTRTVWQGEERHTVRVARPGRSNDRRQAIRESAVVAQ